MARYKFVCRSFRYECVSGIGKEVGPYSSKVIMVCKSCATINSYSVAHPGKTNPENCCAPVCVTCHSSKHLSEWDGFTCPHCNMRMRALGGDVDAEKPFRY